MTLDPGSMTLDPGLQFSPPFSKIRKQSQIMEWVTEKEIFMNSV